MCDRVGVVGSLALVDKMQGEFTQTQMKKVLI